MNPEKNIQENLLRIQEKIFDAQNKAGLNQPVTIVGVTKTHPPDTILAAIAAGITNIGENKVQEAEGKFSTTQTSKTVTKHMIGHLQSNKVKKALMIFDRIDSIDSKKLADRINAIAKGLNKRIPALLEINTSGEKQKHGFDIKNSEEIFSCLELDNLNIEGLMTVGPNTAEETKIRTAFSSLRFLLEALNGQISVNNQKISTLSMGMSNDYLIGVDEGSTMIRIGTAIFGPRSKNI